MKKTLLLLITFSLCYLSQAQDGQWINLSDGTFDHWHIYNHPYEKVSDKWTITDGVYSFNPKGKSDWKVNDLVTNEEFEDFEFVLEWKIEKGGNSGIFYGVKESKKNGTPYMTGPEIQVLDDVNHPDATAGRNGNHQSGSLYDMIPSAVKANGFDQWNSVRIYKKDNVVTVWQNGKLAVTYPSSGTGWEALVAESKFKDWSDFGKYSKGLVGLQDHGNVVSFKNMKIRKL
ncbi:3-keto-disaccharide hydrolase [Jiulongibacter sp. NS-SX5]|uniref:3-keto-disaccharide hydrolase n=1 Tax=Jiulongibacter sp. NS-SX5 TaxID=3463854 RepID=UPI004058474F